MRSLHHAAAWIALVPIALVAVVVGAPSSAWAAASDDAASGLWYYDAFSVGDAVAAGHDGSGVTVAVIEGQIDTAAPELQGADITVVPNSSCLAGASSTQLAPSDLPDRSLATSHATQSAALIVGSGTGADGASSVKGVAPATHLLYYAAFTSSEATLTCSVKGAANGGDTNAQAAASIEDAVSRGASIISLSWGTTLTDALTSAIADAVAHDVVVVAARPNDASTCVDGASVKICGARGVVTVGAMNRQGDMASVGLVADTTTTVVAPGEQVLGLRPHSDSVGHPQPALVDGSSSATAITAGFLADVKSAYPSATGDQLIQTLIRNTGTSDHPLQTDERHYSGYGIVSLTHMLSVDPTQYDDTNPLLDKSSVPTDAQLQAAGAPAATSPSTAPDEDVVTTGAVGWLGLAIVVGILVVLAIVVLVIVLALRSRRRGAPPGASGAS